MLRAIPALWPVPELHRLARALARKGATRSTADRPETAAGSGQFERRHRVVAAWLLVVEPLVGLATVGRAQQSSAAALPGACITLNAAVLVSTSS
jgi:hypothetical protein